MNRKFKYAFSMVELMLLLLIASLIVAASVPIVTKRHLHLPSVGSHGSYICYYNNGRLMEARKSGKVDQKMLAGYPRETTNCVFEPPAKAIMFQVTAIGGGGGGGDSGYKGSLPRTYDNTDTDLLPFGEPDADNNFDGLDIYDIVGGGPQNKEGIGVANNEEAINEFKSYTGSLWAFAIGGDSGEAGPIDYTTYKTNTMSFDCPKNKINWVDKTYTRNVSTAYTLCQGYPEEQTVHADIYYCYKDGGSSGYAYGGGSGGRTHVGSYAKFNVDKATCSETVTVDKYECKPQEGTVDCKKLDKIVEHPAEYRTYGTYISGYTPVEVGCSNPCAYAGQTNCNSGKCYRDEPVYSPCGFGINACKTKDAWTEYIYYTAQCAKPCVNTKVGTEDVTKTWQERTPTISELKWGEISGEGVTCEKQSTGDVGTSVTLSYTKKEADGCQLSYETLHPITVSYEKATHDSSYSRGKGTFCTTNSVPWKLGLKFTNKITFEKDKADDGEHLNKDASATIPKSFCGAICTGYNTSSCTGLGSCGPSVGHSNAGTYAKATIGDVSIQSNTSTKGASGDKLKQKSVTLNVFKNSDDNGIYTKSVTYYYDEVISNSGSNGTAGTCSPASANKPDCRDSSNKDKRVGYCLKHHYSGSDSDAELFGKYVYHDTYDEHSLPKGLPGSAGEFKTVVVRSLTGIDRTIKVGRGGSAAAPNLGRNGSRGSETTFGTILRAEGGEGGLGSQFDPEATGKLPTYDGNNFNYEKVRDCFTTNKYDSDPQCLAWRADQTNIPFYKNTGSENNVGSVPAQKSVGGMFSFALASFGISDDDTIKDLMQFAGKGGNGGGVQHFCWAGQHIIVFEGQPLKKSSVYHAATAPAGVPADHIIPIGCQQAYKNVPAGAGYDGAVIITW